MRVKVIAMRVFVLSAIMVIIGSLAACGSKTRNQSHHTANFTSYSAIPGVTREEINAIESLKVLGRSFTYGTLNSTEAFIDFDGNIAGYSVLLCDFLSGLFGIPFVQKFSLWDSLIEGLNSGTFDFTGDLTPTPERRAFYVMSNPIADRSLGVFVLAETNKIERESDLNGRRIGFLKNSATAQLINKAYPSLNFVSVLLDNVSDSVEMLKSGYIDAFITDAVISVESAEYEDLSSIKHLELFPFVYNPVSMSTAKAELQPVISVLNKFIEAGGAEKFYSLYHEGSLASKRFQFQKKLSTEEREYINSLNAKGSGVPAAFEFNHYPICFYNEDERSFQGIAVEILEEIEKLTGINFKPVNDRNTSWQAILGMLERGEIALVPELMYSERNKDKFLWSDRYASLRYALLSKADYPYLETYQVARATVGVWRESAYEEMYNVYFIDDSNVKYYDTQEEALTALEKGEIDLLMASEKWLLTLTNYLEMPRYKANIRFRAPLEEFYFGFGRNEETLRSIFGKAQSAINTEKIAEDWTGRVYDYSKRIADERFNSVFTFAVVLLILLIIMFFLFMWNARLKKHFENQAITLSTMYKAIPDLVYCMDTDLRFINCNRSYEEFIGLSEADIAGRTDLEIYKDAPDPAMAELLMNVNRKVLTENVTITSDEVHIRQDNSRVLLQSTKAPLIQNGKVIGLLGISRDVTKHKEAEEAAYEASRAKSIFLAKMSHEIRTPMNAIIGMTELALREKEMSAAQRHIVTVKQAGIHLLSLINDILDFSKIEMGKLEILNGDYMFSSLINDVISIIRMRVIDSQLRFAVNVDAYIPDALTGDETRIRQVLLNVLNNAVKYTDRGFVSLTIYGEMTDDETILLTMEVMDSGSGIKQENIHNLFGEYTQFDQEKHRGIEGVGLGLAITWNIVKAMNGNIEVYSEFGKGSLFTITIPQKVRSRKILARVINPKDKAVIVYERREIFANSIVCAMDNLSVPSTLILNDADLCSEMEKQPNAFLFISFSLLEKNSKNILEHGADVKVVVLAEFGEVIPDKKLRVLAMPVYSISVANILNGYVESFSFNENDEGSMVRITAPDAKVLVVDDINTNLKVAEGLMLPYKMQIDLRKSGREAIEAVIFNNYDLVFMDHKMPDMDGIEATQYIRKMGTDNKVYEKLPIIALTANAVSGTREEFLKSGFNDFLSKPIDTIELNSILERWIPKTKWEITAREETPAEEAETKRGEKEIEIEGVDVKRGVFLSGGKIESYLDTLAIYYNDGLEKIKEINAALVSADLRRFTVYVHAFKSACANIGAEGMAAKAFELELAGDRKDMAFIESHIHALLSELETLLGKISGVLKARREKAGKENVFYDPEYLISELLVLQKAIDDLNAGVINRTIENLRKAAQKDTVDAAVNGIAEKILFGEYDEASAMVETLLQRLKNGAH